MKWTYNGEVISSICLTVYVCLQVLFAKLVIGVRYEVSAHTHTHTQKPALENWKTKVEIWIGIILRENFEICQVVLI
jgi:hypothetical protein